MRRLVLLVSVTSRMAAQVIDPNAEYVLVHDYCEPGSRKVVVPKDTVVTVRWGDGGSYLGRAILGTGGLLVFTIKATGQELKTYYGYLFALNTPENLVRLASFRKACNAERQARTIRNRAHTRMITIQGPSEMSRTRLRRRQSP